MAEWICEQCGATFRRARSGKRRIRFCSQFCYHRWLKENGMKGGQFAEGGIPWNKGKAGIRLSPQSEFRKGRRSPRDLPVGSVRVRKQRAFVKVAEPNRWRPRAYILWESAGGPKLRPGYFLHYLDGDTLNDDPVNLAYVNRAFHMKLHRPGFEERRRLAARRARWGW